MARIFGWTNQRPLHIIASHDQASDVAERLESETSVSDAIRAKPQTWASTALLYAICV